MKGEKRREEGKGRVEKRKGREGCLLQLESLDPAVEEGRRARRGARAGASRHFFFPL